jgi:tocopherol O-methyltransferase
LLPGSPPALANADDIRDVIVGGQGDYLKLCEQVWDASKIFNGRLIDIGCGLGGPSIFWAQRHRVHVTAVTIVTEHARAVREFAERAGVGDRLEPLAADFTVVRSAGTFDVATSNEAICYMDRDLVFARASELLPVGGCVCIEDIFLGRPEGKPPFDAYWATSIGPITEYEQAAEIHGFVMDRNEDVTSRTIGHWYWSIAWAQARLTELQTTGRLTAGTELRLLRSIREHARLASGFHNGVYQMRITRFRRVR